nr:PAS/PAC domain-containing protein [uncultured bacterium]
MLGEKANILLVDDRPENLLALEGILEDENYGLFKATSGREALRMVLKHDFDLILLDVQMPGMDGFETAQLIHGKKGVKHIPIIFITAISKEQKYIHKGYEVGAENYLFKPIDPDELKSKLKTSLDYHRYKQQMELLGKRTTEAKQRRLLKHRNGVSSPQQ